MEIQEIPSGRITILEIKGRIDSSNAIDLSNRLRALYTKPGVLLLLDLQGLDYITSAGFRTLLIGRRHAASSGGALAMCGLPTASPVASASTDSTVRGIFILLSLPTIRSWRDSRPARWGSARNSAARREHRSG